MKGIPISKKITVDRLEAILRETFGYASFRGPQAGIVEHVANGGNALVLMPTGGGKSLCYQIPALARPGVAIVVSPLLSLMRNQIQALEQAGVRAAQMSSAVDPASARRTAQAMRAGEVDLVYVAPERLATDGFQALLSETPLALFAIDEAHCVSQWGHDFRPEYLQVGEICARYDSVPRMALTATADGTTRADMAERLRLTDARVFLSSFDRPNITYTIVPKANPRRQLLDFLRDRMDQSGIVYCLSRQRVEETAAFLVSKGFDAIPYHAGMPTKQRSANQDRFITGDGVITVATIAFGMGIDKPDIRWVAHIDLPSSVEAYYQETGRAGRDGLPSDVLMMYGLQDIVQRRKMIEDGDGSIEHKRSLRRRLESLIAFAESADCRRAVLLRYFGERHPGQCGRCDRCLSPVATVDGTTDARKVLSAARRTGERFGAHHLVDILTGQRTDKVVQFRHDVLPTFGVGQDKPPEHWHHVIRQIAASGLLEIPADRHGLALTGEGLEVMRGGPEVRLVERGTFSVPAARTRKSPGTGRSGSAGPVGLAPPDLQLWTAVRAWRAAEAREQGLPPYIVFNDATLLHIVTHKPSDRRELARIHGMGDMRANRYGAALLPIIAAHGKV